MALNVFTETLSPLM
jgi:hypothetical protein